MLYTVLYIIPFLFLTKLIKRASKTKSLPLVWHESKLTIESVLWTILPKKTRNKTNETNILTRILTECGCRFSKSDFYHGLHWQLQNDAIIGHETAYKVIDYSIDYWPSVKLIWRNIGQVLFRKHRKTRSISFFHLSRPSKLGAKGQISSHGKTMPIARPPQDLSTMQ